MATVTSSKVDAGIPEREVHAGLNHVYATYAVPATGNGSAAGDVIQMIKVPQGAVILEVVLTSDDLDTNGSPAIVLKVGDGGDDDRFIAGSTIGQTGGTARLGSGLTTTSTAALGYAYTADDTVDVTITTVAGTKAAGNIGLAVIYSLQT